MSAFIKFVEWKGMQLTSAKMIAEYYCDGDITLAMNIKPYIKTGMNKVQVVKVTYEEIKANRSLFEAIIPAVSPVPILGICLIDVGDVIDIKYYFEYILKQYKNNTYKKDRFKSNRSLYDELRFELTKNENVLTKNEFNAALSYIARLEIGQRKVDALKCASKKFDVSQVKIKVTFDDLNLQIDYVNKPNNYI